MFSRQICIFLNECIDWISLNNWSFEFKIDIVKLQMKLLVEDSCVFEQAISVIDFFDKVRFTAANWMTTPKLQLIELWCEKMHTVNRRLTGTVQIEEGNDKFEHILGRAKSEDGEVHLGAGKDILIFLK